MTVCLDGGGPTGHCSDYEEGSEESYENSFCSYHSDINPGGLASGDANTILYAVIPWTAGGYGDGDLSGTDQHARLGMPGRRHRTQQARPVRTRESNAKKTNKEKEEIAEKDPKKKRQKPTKAELLEGPHEQEPNQQPCPNTNGACDYGLADLIISQIGARAAEHRHRPAAQRLAGLRPT